MVGDTLDVYVNKDDLKFQKRISRYELDNKNINIPLSDYNNTINGKVLTLFEETKQSDILVQLIKIPNGTIQDRAFTDKSGFFSFKRVPKGSYQIFVETAQGKYFYSDKDKKAICEKNCSGNNKNTVGLNGHGIKLALNKILPYKKTMQHKEGPMVL